MNCDCIQAWPESNTISGCLDPSHCGTFRRVAARCERTDGGLLPPHCPGGHYANGNADPSLCDSAPIYQLQPGSGAGAAVGGGGGDGPVLYRTYDEVVTKESAHVEYTQWSVRRVRQTSDRSGPLDSCSVDWTSNDKPYLRSAKIDGRSGYAPTAAGYSAPAGWIDSDCRMYGGYCGTI